MTGAAGAEIKEVEPGDAGAEACLEQYYAELRTRFAQGFDVAKSIATGPDDFARPDGLFLLVTVEGRPIGCGGVIRTAPDVGYIKRMWIAPSHRGLGLGRDLLSALEDAARDLGCRTAQLETNRALTGAIRLYRTSGYREVPPFNDEHYADFWFEKDLEPIRPTTT